METSERSSLGLGRAVVGARLRAGRLFLALAVAVLVLGGTQLGAAKLDFLPEFQPPSVQVQTEALGLSAAEVEQLITVPIEQDLLNGVPWLDRIHSRSQPGLSAVDIVFEPGTDVYAARQMVQERLTQAHALPNVGSPPVMVEPLASVSRVVMVGLTSKTVPLIDMSVLARWKVRPKLMGIPGVANVAIYGQRDRQLQVQVDPATLRSKGVTLTQVIETAGNALWVSPLTFVEASTPGTGGFIEGANQRLAVQHVLPITTAKNLADVSVEGAASSLRLGDVAQVIEDHQPLIGDAVAPDPALYLVIQKFPDADTAAVTKAVDEAMESLAPGLGGITVDTSLYRSATFIESAAATVGLAGALGLAALVLVALLVFWSWRAALAVGLAVAVSAVAPLYVLYLGGRTLTSMTVAGLAAALVLIVTEAAADVEAVRAELRSRAGREGAAGTAQLVSRAIGSTRGTALVGLLLVGLLAAPALVLGPFGSAFTGPLVVTLLLALVVALVVGLTVTPALLVLLAPGQQPLRRQPRFVAAVTGAVARVTARLARSAVVAVAAVAVLLVAGVAAALPQLSSPSFAPTARDLNLLLHVETAPGTSLVEMDRVAGRMTADLRAVPGVLQVGGHLGRAVASDQLGDVNDGELWLTLDGSADYDATRAAISRVVGRYDGIRTQLLTYAADRLAAASTGEEPGVLVRLFGQDLPALRATAASVAKAMGSVRSVGAPRVRSMPEQPTIHVEVDLAAAKRHGLRPGDVRREATTLVSGLTVGNLYEQAKVFDVVVLGKPTTRQNLSELLDVRIDTPSGPQVRLGEVAKVTVAPEPASIVHDDVMRSIDVAAPVQGDPSAAVAEVSSAVAAVPMPAETHLQVLSDAAAAQVDVRRAAVVALFALVGILLILQVVLGAWARAALLLLLAPLGGVGAAVVAPLVGGLGTAGALLGLLTVVAWTLVGGLGLLRAAVEPAATDPAVTDPAATEPGSAPATVLAVARRRAAPVLRCAAVTAAALLPVVVLGERAGSEVLRPFAVTVIGGLVTAVFVLLCLTPALTGRPKGAQR